MSIREQKAKDTVTPTPDHSESVYCPHCGEEFGQESYIATIRELQAEISFKAGKEPAFSLIKRTD